MFIDNFFQHFYQFHKIVSSVTKTQKYNAFHNMHSCFCCTLKIKIWYYLHNIILQAFEMRILLEIVNSTNNYK